MSKKNDDFDSSSRPPRPPTDVEVSDYDATEATVVWKAPAEEDGDLALTGYLVEYRSKGEEEWTEHLERIKPTKRLTAKVGGLNTGDKYQFRVSE